jgi:4-amino-4-deoxy-L-arabinose transferase-like glycosyltransferase
MFYFYPVSAGFHQPPVGNVFLLLVKITNVNSRFPVSNRTFQGLILIISALLFIPYAGGVHLFDWDEINFAECAREMIVTRDFLNVKINFVPFWEKPPLFIWFQVLSMKAFGINEFAARFPNAVCGMASLLFIGYAGRKVQGEKLAFWWVAAYAGSILPHFYFRSGIIDPWFNLMMFIALWFYYRMHTTGRDLKPGVRLGYSALWGGFTGLAILTKGPTALLIVGLATGIAYLPGLMASAGVWPSRMKKLPEFKFRFSDIAVFLLTTLLVGGSWFLLQILNGHSDMVIKFIVYQIRLFTIPDAGHGGHWSYHFIVLLAGVFPASFFALMRFRRQKNDSLPVQQFHWLMLVLFWVVLILFSIVKTKIVHYSSLCYFPLTFIAAKAMLSLSDGSLRWPRWLSAVLVFFALILSLLVSVLPLLETYKDQIIRSGVIKDDFAVANLQAQVTWTGVEWVLGLFLLAAVITAVVMAHRQRFSRALTVLFASTALFILILIYIFPYRIEQYSQRAVIEFCQSKAKEKCYVLNSGYFSYAPLYYADKQPDACVRPMQLLTGPIDRPFYLILKEPEYQEWKHIIPAMRLLYSKNGFVFLVRDP